MSNADYQGVFVFAQQVDGQVAGVALELLVAFVILPGDFSCHPPLLWKVNFPCFHYIT